MMDIQPHLCSPTAIVHRVTHGHFVGHIDHGPHDRLCTTPSAAHLALGFGFAPLAFVNEILHHGQWDQ